MQGSASHQSDARPPPSVLDEAQALIFGERNQSYGHPKDNFTTTAELWQAHLRARYPDIDITPQDVAIMMAHVKLARLARTPKHRDSQVDTAGYIACLSRLEE